jgi:SAM-dependent methyltransferase
MLNWSLRYLPVVSLLDEAGARDVLDVGSGWHGLSAYRAGEVVQTDLRFNGAAPADAGLGRASFVCASVECLPFRDCAFDFVVSLDLMEHLPSQLRTRGVEELTRVARRGVILGFPAGEVAAVTDRRLARVLAATGRPVPDWLDEHLSQSKYPDAGTVTAALPVGWRIDQEAELGNAALMFMVVLVEQLPVVYRVARALDGWYRRRGPLAWVDRGRVYRRLWLLTPE